MGNNSTKIKKINFENILDMQKLHEHNNNSVVLISTLSANEQKCLITHTLPYEKEESVINNLLYHNKNVNIYIYGKNSNDPSLEKKANQLLELGFTNIFVYIGGLFEWLLLQEVYGVENFKTTSSELDLLKLRPTKFSKQYNTNQSFGIFPLQLTNFGSNDQ